MKIEGHGQAKILTQEEIELLFNNGLQTDRDRLFLNVIVNTAYPRFMEFCRDTAMPCPYGDLSIRDVLHQRGICCIIYENSEFGCVLNSESDSKS